MSAILEVRDLVVSYGIVPAIRNVSFTVNEGEIVALIGPNGAGKTTTLHAISGIKKPVSGSILYRGKNIAGMEPHLIVQEKISQVPEGRGIFPSLSVHENILLGAYLRRDKAEIKKDLKWVFEIFPRLEERINQVGGTLSGGEQQMLAIARALMARPSLLLLDEPSMGLAPVIVEDIFTIIQKINRENNTTILLIEQNAKMALSASHRAYVIEIGDIVNSGYSNDLKSDDKIRKAYLGI
jgi:branched-chain amino acid transport system ATP-binding protein